MSRYTLKVTKVARPILVVHGGAGSYLKTTTEEQRRDRGSSLLQVARTGLNALKGEGGKAGVLAAVAEMEKDPRFNAGYGSKLQKDGCVRVSASLMGGRDTRISSVYNVESCLHPSALAGILQDYGDRNLDGLGAHALMESLGIEKCELRTPQTVGRWEYLIQSGENADSEAAIGDSGAKGAKLAAEAGIAMPEDLKTGLPDPENRYGTVGALSLDSEGDLWACTSTGGRGHETPGRVSDSPTPAGNYACSKIAISATGFGEQILDLNICGRIATRVLDGLVLEEALRRSFEETLAHGGLLGVIALTANGEVGYAHSTEACGVAWLDASGSQFIDPHGR